MSTFEHKSYDEQVELLSSRNMHFSNEASKKKAVEKLSIISYYKIKEFARPFAKTVEVKGKKTIDYQGTPFEQVVSRYYQDKKLRLQLLNAIEDIEVALKTQIAYVLGSDDLGAYGYLQFSQWCNKKEYCRHYLNYRQEKFKRTLIQEIQKNRTAEIAEKQKTDNKATPPIWLAINLLTFGQMVSLLELMSKKILERYQRITIVVIMN